MTEELGKTYAPHETEARWYEFWEKGGYFTPEISASREPFTIVIPPPNVTGSLHMGHALNNTIQDVIIRRERMRGKAALWLPGTDHAGIATQNKVEQALAEEGLTRHDLGREKFIERVWEWKEEYGSTIIGQLKKLGCSCDWTRERFTMDEGYSKAVREVFVRLYQDGLIYRGNRIINWCPRCHTALSDIEVEHRDIEGGLWYIRYPLKEKRGHLVIATTRPETLLGDTAVAVNPDDERYRDLIGGHAILPLLGREIPIIADDHVDPAFGTGALKVTPAHDPNDFEIGERHGLKQINIFTPDGDINENGGKFAGQNRFDAREAVVRELDEQGLLEKSAPHAHAVGHCYRCHTVIEPYISDQWFVDMKPLAPPAAHVVDEGMVKFSPERWGRLYFDWLDNIRDWCISRQIWWGHQIPAWYCESCGEITVAAKTPDTCRHCASGEIKQDPDVLDTWFSSALWPFATLGWPEKTADLDYFYPTSVLSTARDILYLWVARMVMCGLKFPEDIPFHTVIIHPTVLNQEGRRMSKSLGTGIDPLELIEKYGTDATRFGLMVQATTMQDMRFTEEKLDMSRNFANKIWNAARFALGNLGDYEHGPLDREALTAPDKWILSRTQKLVRDVESALDQYDFGDASRRLYDFFWSEFCDWYLELVKPRLYGEPAADPLDKRVAQGTLCSVLDTALRLLHPFMPFITEEIWQKLPGAGESLMIASWPELADDLIDEEAEREVEALKGAVTAIRTVRSELKLAPSAKIWAMATAADEKSLLAFQTGKPLIMRLGGLDVLEIAPGLERPPQSAIVVVEDVEIFVPLAGLVDIAMEVERLRKDLAALDKEAEKLDLKLANDNFIERAPVEVVEKEKSKRSNIESRREKINAQLSVLAE